MAWTTRIHNGGSLTVNGVRMTFDRCIAVTLHDEAASITITKPDGRVIGWDRGVEPHQEEGAA